jgi:hypothetical protein
MRRAMMNENGALTELELARENGTHWGKNVLLVIFPPYFPNGLPEIEPRPPK